jgi:3-hydroxypropanoate dehydrogenase
VTQAIDRAALDQIFRSARSLHAFRAEPVSDDTLRELFALASLGPTAFNCQPGRFVFLRTPAAKARLAPALSRGNLTKTMAAPVTVIVATDSRFFEWIENPSGRAVYEANLAMAAEHGFRNGSLQGAYLILAARALGLTAGPMSGFDPARVNQEFFADGRWQANFLVNLGWGDATRPSPCAARLSFEQGALLL